MLYLHKYAIGVIIAYEHNIHSRYLDKVQLKYYYMNKER